MQYKLQMKHVKLIIHVTVSGLHVHKPAEAFTCRKLWLIR